MPIDLAGVKWDSAPAPAKSRASTPANFAKTYGPVAERAGKALGVDPSILLGQWGLETGWGKSVIPGTHNLGNIKDFAGGGVAATDNMTGSRDKYRAYETPEAFADDFVSLVQRKYPGAVGAKDPMAFAKALKEGGYAEDPRYVDKVVQASRMAGNAPGPVMQAVRSAVGAVVPSAQAAEQIDLNGVQWDAPAPAETPRVEVRGTSADETAPSMGERALGAFRASRGVARNIGAGAIRGAGSIGATLLRPFESADENAQRRQAMDDALINLVGADPNSVAYGAGKLGGEIAGTAGVGSALAIPLRAVGAAIPAAGNALARLANATASGGMSVGAGGGAVPNALLRVAGGAATGGASAGLVNPEDATTGATIGAALPGGAALAGAAGRAIGRSLSGGQVAPEVAKLAQRAEDLGIRIPADRITNSRPLNAVAAGLNYVPMSGRQATEDAMQSQLNRALSRTFGQDSDNVTQALRKASADLGGKFDATLKANSVQFDPQLLTDLGDVSQRAVRELPPDLARVINNQIDDITAAGAGGQIDGQLAYNIKRTLDKISNRNSSEAFYARELKGKLMDALDRSLGQQKAADFAKLRQQYGNMLELENLAQNGAEGNISIARIANLKNLNNSDLQELADISAQFLKPREGQHGAAQRAFAGAAAFGLGGTGGLVGGMAAGRVANSLLNSTAARQALLGQQQTNPLLRLAGDTDLGQLAYRAAPVLGAQ